MPGLRGEVAKRYAEALMELATAKEPGTADKWDSDLQLVVDLMGETKLLSFLESPRVRFSDKKAALERSLGSVVDREILNLLFILIQRGRAGLVREIAARFRGLLLERKGIAIAEVTTAIHLPEPRQRELERQLEALFGKTIEMRTRIDPDIIGGLVIQVGDELIDGSVATRLARLRTSLE